MLSFLFIYLNKIYISNKFHKCFICGESDIYKEDYICKIVKIKIQIFNII